MNPHDDGGPAVPSNPPPLMEGEKEIMAEAAAALGIPQPTG
jgi:hypothetical protein